MKVEVRLVDDGGFWSPPAYTDFELFPDGKIKNVRTLDWTGLKGVFTKAIIVFDGFRYPVLLDVPRRVEPGDNVRFDVGHLEILLEAPKAFVREFAKGCRPAPVKVGPRYLDI